MRSRVFLKLTGAFLLVIGMTSVILDLSIRSAWERWQTDEIRESLTRKTQLAAQRVVHDKQTPLATLTTEIAQAASARMTIIDTSGKVLADSEARPETMENHATRPEFKAALAGNAGTSVRPSKTIGIEFMYVAVPTPEGAVRLAYPLASIQQNLAAIRKHLLIATFWAGLAALLLAMLLAAGVARRLRRIVAFAGQIAEGDFSARLQESSFDEIAQVSSALDATARRLEESFHAIEISRGQMQTLLESIPDVVMSVSPETRLLWTNGQFERAFRTSPRIGQPLVESLRDPEVLELVQQSLRTGEVRASKRVGLLPGKSYNVSAAPMPGGNTVVILQDISEVERVEKTRRDFIANVSHELRTPLTSIQGYVETLQEQEGGKDNRFLDIIQKNAVRMSRLTEDLLTLARVESGEHKLELHPVPASALLSDAEETLRELVRRRGMTLRIEQSTAQPVLADRGAIQQVFGNLVENAAKYSQPGAEISIGALEAEGEISFYVRDTGPGIASEHQPRLFERFYRVDVSRSRESGGTGLGLAIVKHIILNHGGKVWVESTLNQGATFYFKLPTAEVKAPA